MFAGANLNSTLKLLVDKIEDCAEAVAIMLEERITARVNVVARFFPDIFVHHKKKKVDYPLT